METGAYYAGIREDKARLDKLYPGGFLFVMSVQNPNAGSVAGVVSHVSTRIAAKHLVENTARIATDAEIADFEAKGRAFNEKMKAEQFNRNRTTPGGSVNLIVNR